MNNAMFLMHYYFNNNVVLDSISDLLPPTQAAFANPLPDVLIHE
jgi:hypothetical protein